MSCVVALEGFQISSQFVVKELTILFDNSKYQHFHFNCPIDLIIAPRDWNTIRYHQNNNGLDLTDDSYLPYGVIGYILGKISNQRIFTAGTQAAKFISDYLPTSEVIDICEVYKFKYPLILERSDCYFNHPSRYCSLSKAKTLKTALNILSVNE